MRHETHQRDTLNRPLALLQANVNSSCWSMGIYFYTTLFVLKQPSSLKSVWDAGQSHYSMVPCRLTKYISVNWIQIYGGGGCILSVRGTWMEYIVSRWMNIKLCVFLTVNNKEFVQKTNSYQYASTLTVQLFLREKSLWKQKGEWYWRTSSTSWVPVIKFHSCVWRWRAGEKIIRRQDWTNN
jgi:hypothetical protein